MRPTIALFTFALFFLAYATVASAAQDEAIKCSPFAAPMRFVGDMHSDSRCTDDNIQSAIYATANNGSACPAKIFITHGHSYTAQALTIPDTGKSITLIGQADDVPCGTSDLSICIGDTCPPPATAPLVTISGAGQTGQSVLHIEGTNDITLRYITISRGMLGDDQSGGGIYFDGAGSLTLDTSVVSFNQAGRGGGIEFTGSGGATLRLGANTLILGNTASASGTDDFRSGGGGIRVEGDARLIAVQPLTLITSNHAPAGYGGGVEVMGPARIDLGSSGYTSGLVSVNDALDGAGIAAVDKGDGGAVVRVFGSVTNAPSMINNNAASHNGGGIYANGDSDICLFYPSLTGNTAEDGAALYKHDSGGIYFNTSPARLGVNCGPESPYGLLGGGGYCYGDNCNLISGNRTEHADHTPSAGAAIYHYIGELIGSRVMIQHNIAANAIGAVAGGTDLSLCIVTDNLASGPLIVSDVWGSGTTTFSHCTFANNSIGDTHVFEFLSQSLVTLTYDIIAQPDNVSVNFSPYFPSDEMSSQFILASELPTLNGDFTVLKGEPGFIDPAQGNYQLHRCSQAVDFAAADTTFSTDFGFHLFGTDEPDMTNLFGTWDLGPYEYAGDDTIFCNGFGR